MKARHEGPSEQSWVDAKRARRMASVDDMAPELRSCVHEFGLTVVRAMIDCGIRNPRHIRHLVDTVLAEMSPTRGAHATQGTKRADGVPSKGAVAA